MFIDRAVIDVIAGTGGSGSEAMRREKGVPRGGPAGGDGGKGGDILLEADAQLATLLDFSYRRIYTAERGMHGAGKSMTGRSGDDLVLKVPPGTVAYDADSDERLGELVEPGQSIVVALGGRGGRGNTHFKTATQQAPRRWEPGGEGEQRRVRLELKLIADVGLVGEPNAGKSTFLAAVTAARPKVADYPFTTLSPNLGVVQLSDFRTFVVADIPGIIEGAHEGKGLGHQFLRHIERTRTLALVIPVDAADVQVEYEALRSELEAYSSELSVTPHCVMLTKTDLLPPDESLPELDAPDAWGVFGISSVAQKGLDELLQQLWRESREAGAGETPDPDEGWWSP
ncbi:MAG TPA: GTPase ObgE [Gemmatimonadetes bacterium]|nr:GTPase ObgE [Gemmatimonadota bacterium]HBD97912.1 GTPase ObgE [Gemmatimonadota bacterium]HIC53273.1 GTPase ObgE [Gemmatimonadota bacterium]HIN51057.1 GTPase ObgE [Gemmatimonadota bacterium]